MELRHLRYFVAVAEEASFTRAAERVGIGQPPLSQQIRSLERELGADLFRRLPHGVRLTDVGLAFLPEARATLAQARQAARTARRAARGQIGRLRLGFTGSAAFNPIVPGAIRVFRSRYPGVEITVEEESTTRLLRRLEEDRLDAAFVRSAPESLDGFRSVLLDEEPMVAVLPSGHPLAEREAVPLALFAGGPLVLFPRAEGPGLFDAIVSALLGTGVEPTVGMEAPGIASVANLVAAGFGVSVVPASLDRVAVPGVVVRPFEGRPPIAPLSLATGPKDPSAPVRNLTLLSQTVAAERDSWNPAGQPPLQ